MKFNTDTATTILGGLIAAGTAAQPVIATVEGSLNTQNWFQLATAVLFAVFGFFSNKQPKVAA